MFSFFQRTIGWIPGYIVNFFRPAEKKDYYLTYQPIVIPDKKRVCNIQDLNVYYFISRDKDY